MPYGDRRTRWLWRVVGCVALLATGAFVACSTSTIPEYTQQLVILGFDGMDPELVEQYMADGKLPHMADLAAAGDGVHRLETTHSPDSPTAWATFATGVNPGKHNIYDFLVRDTKTYLPAPGMVEREPARFLLNYFPTSRPAVRSIRGGTSFWVTAGLAGVRSRVLAVPLTYPPEDVPNGELLAGLPLPDIRGTMGTFSYFTTDLSAAEERGTECSGIVTRLDVIKDVAQTALIGPPHPIARQQLTSLRAKGQDLTTRERLRLEELSVVEDVRIPFTIRWNRDAPDPRTATIAIQEKSIHLREGEWSRWIDLEFRVNLFMRLRGMAQLYLANASDELQLYVSPVNWHPVRPPLPISSPPSFAQDLYERLGPYRTLGWTDASRPLNEDRLDEGVFMDDIFRAFDDRAEMILSRLDTGSWNLLVGAIESTDRVQHMMWRLVDPDHPMYDAELAARFGDAIERIYRRSDELIGEVRQRLDPNTLLLVVSDHGFHSWRKSVNLNTWLVEEGYMALRAEPTDTGLDDGSPGGRSRNLVDWSRTRAYAMGLGQIYFNVRGREVNGIVGVGVEYRALADKLSADLLTLKDPDTDAAIVRAVYKRDDVYHGPYVPNASDLQVGFADGYRVSWETTRGGSPPGVIHDNLQKWSGGHGGFDHAATAGVLLSSRPMTAERARLVDIAPTVLRYFNVALPSDLDGRPLF